MNHAIDVYYFTADNPHGCDSVTMRTEADLTRVLHDITTNPQPHPTVVYVRDRPTNGRRELPNHQLKFDIDPDIQVAAIHTAGTPDFVPHNTRSHDDAETTQYLRGWVSRADTTTNDSRTPGKPLYVDVDTRTEFPRNAAIPLERLRTALLELMITAQRPTCVDWQDSEITL
ncbi:hypothetical protein GCM10022243_01160 [Saccharothrix violaceirubra]|uniref:Immunity protein Imm1 n=1 Tax=Saccharothrix violaceirubra TaxID=413306 RepID=A0A7W7WWB1_9PSEU|nr:Imm1 family immunity protein [Saccharothrix violaceirubra]MBB4965388.1 hypothetical protein [Saccharothrix violaceirubra]